METTQRYFGRLIFPEGDKIIENIWLNINGNKIFVELPDPSIGIEDWAIVYGEFNKIGTVSLLECSLGSQVSGFGGNERKLSVHKLVNGIKLDNITAPFISSVSLSCPTLMDWIHVQPGVEWTMTSASVPEALELLKIDTPEFELAIKDGHRSSFSVKEISFKRSISIHVTFKREQNIYEFYVWKKHLEKLIVFLTNEDPQIKIENINKSPQNIFGIDSTWQSNRYSHSIDFKYPTIKQQLPDIISNWFTKTKLLPIIELVSEKKQNPDLSIPRYFLNMCVAYESLHREFIRDEVSLTDNSIIVNRDKIKGLLHGDNELLQWFRKKSNFWKKPELYDRLMDCREEFQLIVGNVFVVETEVLLKMIKDTRHKLAHEGKHNTKFKTEFELFIVAYSLELFLQIQIIKILGVTDQAVLSDFFIGAHNGVSMFAKWNNFKGIEID